MGPSPPYLRIGYPRRGDPQSQASGVDNLLCSLPKTLVITLVKKLLTGRDERCRKPAAAPAPSAPARTPWVRPQLAGAPGARQRAPLAHLLLFSLFSLFFSLSRPWRAPLMVAALGGHPLKHPLHPLGMPQPQVPTPHDNAAGWVGRGVFVLGYLYM